MLFGSTSTLSAALYGAMAFAIQLLHAPFITFFVDFSSRHLNLSFTSFVLAQLVYVIWNSSNEFLFGYRSDIEDAEILLNSTTNQNDHVTSSSSPTSSGPSSPNYFSSPAQRRMNRIRKYGTFWAFAFILLWIPLSDVVFQFTSIRIPQVIFYILVLIFYDGCFAYVTVQHRALLVNIASDEHERQKCTLWSSVLGGFGSLSVVAASAAYSGMNSSSSSSSSDSDKNKSDSSSSSSENNNSLLFWWLTILGIACFAAMIFWFIIGFISSMWNASLYCEEGVSPGCVPVSVSSEEEEGDNNNNKFEVVEKQNQETKKIDSPNNNSNNNSEQSDWYTTLQKISNIPPMRTVYIVWMLQELCCCMLTTFFVSATTEIVTWGQSKQKILSSSSSSSSSTLNKNQNHNFFIFNLLGTETWTTLAVGCSFIIPQVVLVGLLPFVRKYGLDYVIASLFRFRVLAGIFAFILFTMIPLSVGPVSLILALLLLRLATECVCRLQPLILAALCDDQPSEWTASIFGASSLGSKPSQSIAPVLGYWLLREIAKHNSSNSNNNNNKNNNSHVQQGSSSLTTTSITSSTSSFLLLEEERAIYLYGWLLVLATVPTAIGSLIAWNSWPLPRVGKSNV